MKKLGDRLRLARENKNLTQTQVYKDTGIHNKTLSGYERNVSEPDYDTLKKIARYYNVSTDFLLGITEKMTPYEPETIAAHHDGDEFTEEEVQSIEEFKEFLRARRENKK